MSVTGTGRQVVDQATARRRALLAEILGRLPAGQQAAVAAALHAFAAAAGEIPDSQWQVRPAEAESEQPARAGIEAGAAAREHA